MNKEHKRKLAQIEKVESPKTEIKVFASEEMEELHTKLSTLHEVIIKLIEQVDLRPQLQLNERQLIELNNTMVKLISKYETGVNIKNFDKFKAATEVAVSNLDEIVIPEPNIKFPQDLVKDETIKNYHEQLIGLMVKFNQFASAPKPKQGQNPTDYIPFRRVRLQGDRLVFDDKSWAGASGSGGGAASTSSSSSGAADVQYAENATTSPGTGNLALGRYSSTPPSLTNGQLQGLQLDSSGALKVTGSLSVGGTTDNSAFTASTSTGTPAMGFYHSIIDTVSDGRSAVFAITSKRSQITVLSDDTNQANILKSDGTAAGQNALITGGTNLEVSFSTAIVAAVASTDVKNYRGVSVHIVTQGGSSTVTFQGSNDNTNWVSVGLTNTNATSSSGATSTTSAGVIFYGALNYRYFRLNVTGIASGTTAGVVEFSTLPPAFGIVGSSTTVTANQGGTWTVGSNSATGSAVPANAFYVAGNNGAGNLTGTGIGDGTSDGYTTGRAGLQVVPYQLVYNGTTWDRVRSDGTTGGLGVGGTVASAATDSGNPVKIGAKFNSTPPTFTDGQRGDAQIDARGNFKASLWVPSGTVAVNYLADNADAVATSSVVAKQGVISRSTLFNGTTWDRTPGDSIGGTWVQGAIAAGVADTGNPVKIGGKYNATLPTLTDGNRGDIQLGSRGALRVELYRAGQNQSITSQADNADGTATTANADSIKVTNRNSVFNGTTWDRMYGDATNGIYAQIKSSVALALAAGSALVGKVGIDQTTPGTTNAVSIQDVSGNGLTSNSTTYTAKKALDGNLLGTLGTAFSTAGKVDVKGADGDVFVRQATASNLNATVVGQATGSAVPAASFYGSGIAKTSLPSAATDGNLTGNMVDKFGRQVVVTDAIRDIVSSQTTTISASTSETTIGTAVASTFLDVTGIVVANTSTTATRVDFRDTTAGSVLFSLYVPASDSRGIVFHTPQPQTTVNTNWTAQSSVSVTDLRVFLKFIKNK